MTHLAVATVGRDLALIVRLLAGLRVTGRLHVAQDRWTGEVGFDQGRIVAAAFGAERGLPALEVILLALPDGQCTFRDQAPPAESNIPLPAAALEAQLDQLAQRQAQLASAVPSLMAIPQLRPPPEDEHT